MFISVLIHRHLFTGKSNGLIDWCCFNATSKIDVYIVTVRLYLWRKSGSQRKTTDLRQETEKPSQLRLVSNALVELTNSRADRIVITQYIYLSALIIPLGPDHELLEVNASMEVLNLQYNKHMSQYNKHQKKIS